MVEPIQRVGVFVLGVVMLHHFSKLGYALTHDPILIVMLAALAFLIIRGLLFPEPGVPREWFRLSPPDAKPPEPEPPRHEPE